MIFMPKIRPQENLLVCEDCAGTGYLGIAKCLACRGRGAGIFSGKYFLYWGGARTASDVPLKRARRAINKIIDAGLILFSIYGFLNLGYQIYLAGFLNLFTKSFWTTPNRHLLIFFISLLAILYFSSRATRLAHFFENPLRLGFGEKLEIAPALTWRDVKEHKAIDVAKSFSLHSEQALEAALVAAKKYKTSASPEFLFLALLKMPKVRIIFGRLGIAVKTVRDRVLRNLTEAQEKNIRLSPEVLNIFLHSYLSAATSGHKKVRSNVVFLEAAKASKFLQEIFYDLNVDSEKLQNVVKWIEIQDKLRERYLQFRRAAVFRSKGPMNRAMTAVATPALDRVSEDLTWHARRGMIDLCLGREEIIESIFRIIDGGGRGAALVGERGVGKSAIVEGVAELMLKENVPKILRDKRLVSISLSEIMGGASGKEAGVKLMAAIEDAMRAGNIVLHIANLEYFANEGAAPLAALLAEELQRYKLPVLSTITPEGYKKVIEGTALSGIFERVDVPEPDTNLAIQILEAESGGIEYKTQVYFSYDAIVSAVKLSDKYLHERYLPDKAIEIIKEAAMYAQNKRGRNSIVTSDDVAKVVSEKGKVPVASITESEREKLLKLEEVIHQRIIGQAEAVEAVSSALRRAGAGMHEGKKPIANFLFLGPTGVGKTELAKTIAEVYFGDENNMIRVDMSEYQEKSGAERMIGGKGEAGILTEAVRGRPSALLLLDELEKAHSDILNLFLQVMDDGRLTDGRGRTVDFTNLIIVATSNAGSDYIAKEIDKGTTIENIKNKLLEEKLGAYFKPEFLNRFDGVIVFRPLTPEEIVKIAQLLIKKIARKLSDKGVEIIVEEPALRELSKLGFDPKFGARPLRRVLAKEIEDRLANMLLQGRLRRRDKIVFHDLKNIEVVQAKKL